MITFSHSSKTFRENYGVEKIELGALSYQNFLLAEKEIGCAYCERKLNPKKSMKD